MKRWIPLCVAFLFGGVVLLARTAISYEDFTGTWYSCSSGEGYLFSQGIIVCQENAREEAWAMDGAYSAIKIALALADAFGCGVNDLPLSMVLSWYEQKAVCILLTLLYLGIRNIRLGPTLPAFISPNVLDYLVKHYNIAPITTPEEDLKAILGE